MDLILFKKCIKTLIVGEKYKYKYKCIQSVPFFTKITYLNFEIVV